MSRAARHRASAPFECRWKRHPLSSKDFLSVLDLAHEELERLLELAAALKPDRGPGASGRRSRSRGKHVALLFEKPSLRTRTTFVVAVRELGGDVIEPPPDVVFGGRETVEDVARNLERWVDGGDRPHLRAGATGRIRRRRAAHARRQRADR